MSNNERSSNFPDRIIRETECRHLTGLCRTTRYVMEKKGTFPARRQLGGRSVGWRLSEVQSWIANQLTIQTSNAT
ncbi:helix-turn-helix transcriptional regulator [Enterobacter bugandensis]|uniref:helix-turn-helix transcriptional regulator n=1 Tax=Enterobacter bugandensis TaxID=881260 RepID=UPI0021CE9F6E|nr:AlpA family phage regulatory protein [Enterobacter bugandensis]MCU6216488.1 AlpA family phage regulatory protein [Enterobacter bugandensis]